MWSYLRGRQQPGGWWYYYAYAFFVKTPIGVLILIGLAVWLTFTDSRYRKNWRSEIVMLAPAVTVFVLVSSQTGFSRHYRYVLPALPFLYLWMSKVGLVFSGTSLRLKALVIGCVIWTVVSSLSVFPFSLSYFNELAGGPANGWKHLVDSNIDWGQDLGELKHWYDRNPEARPLHLAYFGAADPRAAGIDFMPVPRGIIAGDNDTDDPQTLGPLPGWYAISVNHLVGYKHAADDLPYFTYFQFFRPTATVGYSIYIYHLDRQEVNRVRRQLGLPMLSVD